MRKLPFLLLSLALPANLLAQTSASFRLTEFAIQEGGHPESGQVLHSASLRMTLDAVGDSVPLLSLASPSYELDSGFAVRYPPPGEVNRVMALDKTRFEWEPEASAGTYDVYRGLLDGIPASYGTCNAGDLAGPSVLDPDAPDRDSGELAFFYLVTVRNRLREEGTMGATSAGVPRANTAPCP